jgi:hypothetical protein
MAFSSSFFVQGHNTPKENIAYYIIFGVLEQARREKDGNRRRQDHGGQDGVLGVIECSCNVVLATDFADRISYNVRRFKRLEVDHGKDSFFRHEELR